MRKILNLTYVLVLTGVILCVWCAPAQTVKEPVGEQPTVEQRTEAEQYYSIGFEYYKHGNYEEAVVNFDKAIQLWPQFYAAYIALAKAHRAKGDILATEECYNDAKKLDPKDARSWEGLGALYTELKEYSKAITEYEGGLRNDTTNVNLLNGLGYVYVKMGSYDKGLEYYDQSLAYEPENLATIKAIADIYIAKGETDTAVSYLETIIAKKPGVVEVREKLGQVYIELKRYEAAVTLYQKLIEEQPDNADYHVQLGVIYGKQKKYQIAEEELNTARRLAPNSAVPIYQLADLNIERGRFGAAEELVNEALRVDPDNLYAYLLLGDIYERRGFDGRNKWMQDKSAKNCSTLNTALGYFRSAVSHFTKAKPDAQWSQYCANEINRCNNWLKELEEDRWFYCKGGSQ